jgi:hypothetical protein
VGGGKSRNQNAHSAFDYDRNIDPAKPQETRLSLDVPKK